MIDWLKNITNNYPEFYKKYLESFKSKSNRFVVITTETTGLNVKHDVVLSFAGIAVVDDQIVVSDSFEIAIAQYKFLHDNQLTNAFYIDNSIEKATEEEAIKKILSYINNATLVGHRIHFDIEMINEMLDKFECGKLKNEAMDVEVLYKKLHDINDKDFSINDLSKLLKTPISERNSVSEDVYTIALLFLKLKSRLGIQSSY